MSNKAVLDRRSPKVQPPGSSGRRPAALWSVLLVVLVTGLAAGFWIRADELATGWHLSRAKKLLAERKNAEALTELRFALRRDLSNPETLLLLARAHRRLGNTARAAALLNQASASKEADGDRVRRELQLIQAQSGDLRQVEPHLPEMLVNAGDDGPDICQAFVQGFFANARTKDATDLLDVWEKSYPDDPEPVFMRAYLKQGLNHLPEAIALYRKGLAMAPDRTMMRRRLAEALVDYHQFDEAEAELDLCMAETPGDPEVYLIAAKNARERGETELAVEHIVKSLKLDPHHVAAKRLKGQLEFDRGNLEIARKDLQEVVDQTPNDIVARDTLGRTLRALGQTEEAKAHLEYVSQAESNLREVDRLVRESIQQPENAELRYQIGTILFRFGTPDDAAKWMKAAIELQPNHAGAHQALAAFFESRGDASQAFYHRQRSHENRQP